MRLSPIRTGAVIAPDQTRVLLRPFDPGDADRARRIIARIMLLPEKEVPKILESVCKEFSLRHRNIRERFRARYDELRLLTPSHVRISPARQMLIGSYFLAEYSLESAALFNPSIVPHPDQEGVAPGGVRFILSLRATGEGHVSSITFRTGTVHVDYSINVDAPGGFLEEPKQIPNPVYEKALFSRTMYARGLKTEAAKCVLEKLANKFTLRELRLALDSEGAANCNLSKNIADGIWTLARSNHEVRFDPGQPLSERVLFPATPEQSNGIEDARFVRFAKEDGTYIYFATFTAFNGRAIFPELVETADFLVFRFTTLNGPAAVNKGMALFPRKLNGLFAMLSRQDNENIYIMFSGNPHFWNEHTLILKPLYPWEMVQIGNCGSPIETEAGWLVLSHGVGPMRRYCIGAFLLDLADPTIVIGRLREPLLEPNAVEREGYVPNVVYSCGALVHNGMLIIPYAMADHSATFAMIPLADVLAAMETEV